MDRIEKLHCELKGYVRMRLIVVYGIVSDAQKRRSACLTNRPSPQRPTIIFILILRLFVLTSTKT